MKYERLTTRNEVGKPISVLCEHCHIQDKCDFSKETCCNELADRLADLEDKIESGELDFSCNVPKDETDCVLLQAKYDIALRKYAKLRRIVTRYNVMTKTVDNEITEEAEARLKELQGE